MNDARKFARVCNTCKCNPRRPRPSRAANYNFESVAAMALLWLLLAACLTTTAAVPPANCSLPRHAMRINGYDIGPKHAAATPDICCALCAGEPRCKAFCWVDASTCWLKTAASRPQPCASCVAGYTAITPGPPPPPPGPPGPPRPGPLAPIAPMATALKYVRPAVSEAAWTVWGASPVVDDAGTVHLFVARWPGVGVTPGWYTDSELARYTAASPEGPFHFNETVLRGSGVPGAWDRYSPSNPEVERFGDTYAIFYIANSDTRKPAFPLNQQIGLVTAPTPAGPWRKAGRDGLIINNTVRGHFSEGHQVVNPTAMELGGKYYVYFKSGYFNNHTTVFGLATSEALHGPYSLLPEPVLVAPRGAQTVFEDAQVFHQNGSIYVVTTDNYGTLTGVAGALALWKSKDGIHFSPDIQLAAYLLPHYLPHYTPSKTKRVYGGTASPQRPKILVQAGRPSYLYVASGWVYDGKARCESHVFRIDLPAE